MVLPCFGQYYLVYHDPFVLTQATSLFILFVFGLRATRGADVLNERARETNFKLFNNLVDRWRLLDAVLGGPYIYDGA